MQYTAIKKGAAIGLLALLLATALPAPQAKAATLEELQNQITILLAQINALQGQMNVGSSTSCTPFISDLTIGRSGAEVTRLQQFLITKGYTIPAGATGYFGEQTRGALSQFQNAENIVPAVGYFGPITRTKVNALCTPTVPTVPADDNGGSTPTTPTTPAEEQLSGEASFEKFDVKSGDDTNLEEGARNASIMEIEFTVRDGDARINRIDLGFTADSGNNERRPWNVFTEVAIYNGNERLARIDTSDEDAWTKDSPSEGDYRIRTSGLNWLVEEGTDVELTVKVITQKSIRGANDGEVWNIFVPDNGIRGLDADRVSVFTGDSADGVTVDIDEAGSRDELIVKRSDNDPDATTLQLKDNARSGWTTVFAFDLDTDDSKNDIEIRKIPVQFTVGSSTVDTFMRDVRIVIDGKTYTKKTITDGSTNTVVFEFNRDDLVVEAGDRVTAKVDIDFKQLPVAYEGTTFSASVDTANIIAEGADDLSGSQLSGAARSETHVLRTSGAIIAPQSSTATAQANSSATTEDDEGVFSLKFDVTAFDSDIFVARSAERGTDLGIAGVNFVIEDSSLGGTATASGTVASSLSSNAKIEGGFYKVTAGETKSFTLTVVYNSEYQSFYNLQLHSLNWNITANAPIEQQLAIPESKFETTVLTIRN